MSVPRCVLRMFPVGIILLGAGVVSGQEFPTKPIRVVTSEVGGGNDLLARLVAQAISCWS